MPASPAAVAAAAAAGEAPPLPSLIAAAQRGRELRVFEPVAPALSGGGAGGPPRWRLRPALSSRLRQGVRVTGLAADPSGAALAVSDEASGAILVLPWPIYGRA